VPPLLALLLAPAGAAQGGRTVDEEDPLPRKHVHFTDVSDSGSEGEQEDMSQALALHDAG
jgi:hypothetical protein